MDADEKQLLLDQARVTLNKGRFREAEQFIEKVIKADPDDDQALNLKGLLLFRQDRYREAVGIFERLTRTFPDEPTLRNNFGLALLKSEQYDRAIVELEHALDLGGNKEKTHNYLGLALSALGKYKEAQVHFNYGGSKKMAEQMLSLMSGADAPKQAAAPVAVQVAPAKTSPPLATTVAAPPAPVPAAPASVAVTQAPLPVQPIGDGTIHDITFAEDHMVGGEEEEETDDSGDDIEESDESTAAPDQVDALKQGALPIPSLAGLGSADVMTIALQALQERFGSVAETSDVGKNLKMLAEKLTLRRRPDAALEVVRPGVLRMTIGPDGGYSRATGMLANVGDLNFAPARKRYKGKELDSTFGHKDNPVYQITGSGEAYFQAKEEHTFQIIPIEGELIYLLENVIFAFAGDMKLENGRIPAATGADLHLVQYRGHGHIVVQIADKLGAVPVPLNSRLTLPVQRIVGWFGNSVPTLLDLSFPGSSVKGGAVQFRGEGVVLVSSR